MEMESPARACPSSSVRWHLVTHKQSFEVLGMSCATGSCLPRFAQCSTPLAPLFAFACAVEVRLKQPSAIPRAAIQEAVTRRGGCFSNFVAQASLQR